MIIKIYTKAGFLITLCVLLAVNVKGQQPDTTAKDTAVDSINKARLTGLIIGGSAIYAGTMFGLYQLWYKDYPQSSFHFINDNDEWLQLDKCGHSTTAYYLGMVGYESFRWAGVDKRKSAWYGGSLGFMYLTIIEILDGFSAEWGASGGDLLANTFGSAAFISQQLIWDEQRFQIKWSVHLTDYAQYNPELLGSNTLERVVKDYNGHTYWVSGNIYSFLKKDSRFPKWLNVAAGYGGEGMTGASSNPTEIDGVPLPYFDRYRKYYIAPDIDLSRIDTGSQTVNMLLKFLGIFKFPLPTLEFSNKGVKFHALYF
jgi:hypothetical protein